MDALKPPKGPLRPLAVSSRLDALVPWVVVAIATAALYFAKPVLLPVVLAALLSFLLAPVAALFRRGGLPRAPAAVFAVLLALGAFAAVSAVIVTQAETLAKDAPVYAQRITEKVQAAQGELTRRFDVVLRDSHLKTPFRRSGTRPRASALPPPTESGALPVEIRPAPATAVDELKTYVLPILAPLETTVIVLIITVFILLQKEELRDRLIRLMGAGDLHRSTIALDDAGKRLSRYFLSQFAVNAAFGAVVWGGLLALDVPAAGLWGILAGLLRFVPYIGSLIAAVGPLAIAAAVQPGWDLVIYVALLFLILEPLTGYVIEPLLFGRSTGLLPISVVVAALFWTWIWGPIGLVLSMPLTLTLVVLGRHVPAFAVFDILLGDCPPLSNAETFYQRVLAGHTDEALEHAETLLETMTLAEYYDDVVLRALRLAAADVDRGAVPRLAMHAVCEAVLEVVGALTDHPDGVAAELPARAASHHVVCVPGRGPLDTAVAAMVAQLLRRAGSTVHEHDRLLGVDAVRLDMATAQALCILGLFDRRDAARIQPLIDRLQGQFSGAVVLLGVQRALDDAAGSAGPPAALATLAEFRSELAVKA